MLTKLLTIVESTINDELFTGFAMCGNIFDDVIISLYSVDKCHEQLVYSFLFFLISSDDITKTHFSAVIKDSITVNFNSDVSN